MSDLYSELKPQMAALAEPLFDVSQTFVRKRGCFLPHGAVLEDDGDVRLMMATSEELGDEVTPPQILPVLHEALRQHAREQEVEAVAVCEDVTITPEGQKPTKAVKVLFEHRRGLAVALYLPWKKKLLGGHVFGEVISRIVEPEVRPWDTA